MSNYSKKEETFIKPEDVVVSYSTDGSPYSYYSSDKWMLWSLGFNVNFINLSGEFLDVVKFIVHKIINERTVTSKNSAIKNVIRGAVIFEKVIAACGGFSYSFIDEDKNYRHFLLEAQKEGLKLKTWKNYLIFVSYLYREGFIKRDIGNAEKLAIYLSANSEVCTQTLCLPEKMAAEYYGAALKMVDDYHPYRHSISSSYKEYTVEYSKWLGTGITNVEMRQHALRKVISLPKYITIPLDYAGWWISKLRGACYIVIAAFTGCRDGEVRAFNLDSYDEKEYSGIKVSILNGVHTKPNVGGVERRTSWVTIPAVKKAIELIWDSFDFAREQWEEKANYIKHSDEKELFLEDINSLFINLPYLGSLTPKVGRQSISHSIKNFVKSVGYSSSISDVQEFNLLNPTRHGELKVGGWLSPNPHAFRRTFAVYLVRNKLASLLDVKYQFKHMNIAMTSWYANQANIASHFDMMADAELQDDIAGENESYITDTFYYLYNEAETLAGPEGRRIRNLRSEGDATIYLSREEIFKQVKEGQLSIVEHPSGYCTNPNCDRICDMTICQYKVVTKDKAISLISIRDKLIVKYNEIVASGIDIPNVMSKIYFEVRSIEKILSEHNLEYEMFNKEIFQS